MRVDGAINLLEHDLKLSLKATMDEDKFNGCVLKLILVSSTLDTFHCNIIVIKIESSVSIMMPSAVDFFIRKILEAVSNIKVDQTSAKLAESWQNIL